LETKGNILIVDDDESTCKTLAFIFNKKGYNVETVGTGLEALEIAQHKRFNLVLLDIKLPDIEGIDLLLPLKKLHPHMETMMITAFSSLETVIRALNEGASAYIMKPLNIDDVLNKIKNIFNRQRLIAEKMKLEQDLQYQAMLMENISDAIISIDNNLIIKSWNKAAEIMYGWKSDEIIGKAMSEIIPEDALHAQNEEVREQIFEKGFWKGEIIQKNKDNTKLNIFSSATLIKDKVGKNQGVVVINQDVTDRKKAEEELRESEERLNSFMESATDGFFLYDSELNIININKVGLSLWPAGTKKEDLIGKNILDFATKIKESGRYDNYIDVIKTGTPFFAEDISGHPEFGEIHLAISAFKVGEGMGLISTNITERKKAEAELGKMMRELKSSNKELEQFAYVASHDLQEPLRMIVSFIQLLEKRYKDKLDEDANDFIAYIVDGAKRMQLLINDLLNYSRIGRKDQQLSHLDINSVLKAVINNLTKTIKETNAKITFDPLPTLMGNKGEYIQLFQNLISNAIKFHKEEEPPVVHISAICKKNQWIFSVRDNGIGIDSQFFDRIFIIFQRLHKKDEYEGTGIGLAICKKIVENHGGKIWVESELGQNSTFYFSILKTKV